MLNPTRDTKTPLSSRIALSGALLLAGIFGLGTAVLLPVKKFKNQEAVRQHEEVCRLVSGEGAEKEGR